MSGPMVPAAPVRAHVQHLLDQGMRQAAIYHAANTSSAALSALLYGQFKPGRPPQQTIGADIAARLLAVEFQAPPPKEEASMCGPANDFKPVGYRVGRCVTCGQVAPVQSRHGVEAIVSHPRAHGDVQELPKLAAGAHPDCGHTKGLGRHRREGTELCGPCRNVERGYQAGYRAAMTRAARDARNAVPAELAAGIVAFCRAFVLQPWPPGRPLSQSRALAKQVVQIADAELVADDGQEAA